jgi:hypothetical protein
MSTKAPREQRLWDWVVSQCCSDASPHGWCPDVYARTIAPYTRWSTPPSGRHKRLEQPARCDMMSDAGVSPLGWGNGVYNLQPRRGMFSRRDWRKTCPSPALLAS